ncbi:hypothetical protein BO221_09585 [Archangium sp. Cb G35]|uniref:hypothetical protein n=1 Tax=Archangium sp. Cb G35 TaxID=1920190 RepID=UPI00093765D8|nr:hypothetical protein [Archangium sp. Cb G35]OJT26068.1 hypothetical protein BO221_09585 [Archangium sp. Cb G35]
MTRPLRLDPLVNLVWRHAPDQLRALQSRFGDHPDLKPGRKLGPNSPASVMWLELAMEGLRVATTRVKPNLAKLRKRLGMAKTLRLVSSVIAALTGVGLIAALAAKNAGTKTLLTATLNFLATSTTLFANHLETSLYGGHGSLVDVFEELTASSAQAEQLLLELEGHLRTKPESRQASEAVRRASVLAANLLSLENRLWGSRVPKPPRARRPPVANVPVHP